MKFSPFVFPFYFNYNGEKIVCLFHSLTLKKVYLSDEMYKKILEKIKNNVEDNIIKKLKEIEFIIEDNVSENEIFERFTSKYRIEKPKPTLSYIFISDFCNLRCKYCFVMNTISSSKFITKELADKIIKIIEKVSKNLKNYKIIFYGGEPLLNFEILRYFVERLSKIDKNKFKFSVVTNATLVNDEIAKFLKEYDINVGISLDGWYELNKNRVYLDETETFYDVLKGLSILKRYGVKVAISCTVTKDNFLYLEEIVDFFNKLGIKSIGFNIILDVQNLKYSVKNPKLLAYYLFKAFRKARELGVIEDRIGRRRAKPLFEEKPRFYDCPAFGNQIFFSPKGSFGPCQAFYMSGLYQEEIKESFEVEKSKVLKAFIEMGGVLKNENCKKCPAIGICGGSCAYDVYTKTGKLDVVDPYFCEVIKEILKYLLIYYYEVVIRRIKIVPLSTNLINLFENFFKELKNEKEISKLMDIDKIQDVKDWIGWGIRGNEEKSMVFLVAKDLLFNKIIGFCNIVKNKEGFYEIGIAILKEYRGKRIGDFLLNKTLKKAKEIGIREVYAFIKEENEISKKFFERNKFKKIGKKENKLIYLRKI